MFSKNRIDSNSDSISFYKQAITFFKASPPSLSSSFGINFPIITEYADSGYQKSTNSGKLIMGRESYESKPRHPRRGSGGSSYDLSTQEDDISELVKAIDNRKPLRLFGESSISVDLNRSQMMLNQFQNLQSTSKSVPGDQLHHPKMKSNNSIPLTVTLDTQYEEERNQNIRDDNMLFDMSELNIS